MLFLYIISAIFWLTITIVIIEVLRNKNITLLRIIIALIIYILMSIMICVNIYINQTLTYHGG